MVRGQSPNQDERVVCDIKIQLVGQQYVHRWTSCGKVGCFEHGLFFAFPMNHLVSQMYDAYLCLNALFDLAGADVEC